MASREARLARLALGFVLLAAAFFFVLPGLVERHFNRTLRPAPYAASPRAQEIFMSVLQTCKRLGLSGLDFVSRTLRAFGNPVLPRPVLLTPR